MHVWSLGTLVVSTLTACVPGSIWIPAPAEAGGMSVPFEMQANAVAATKAIDTTRSRSPLLQQLRQRRGSRTPAGDERRRARGLELAQAAGVSTRQIARLEATAFTSKLDRGNPRHCESRLRLLWPRR